LTFGVIDKRSEHLVFGEFSGKFATAAKLAPHLGEPVITAADPGGHPNEPDARHPPLIPARPRRSTTNTAGGGSEPDHRSARWGQIN